MSSWRTGFTTSLSQAIHETKSSQIKVGLQCVFFLQYGLPSFSAWITKESFLLFKWTHSHIKLVEYSSDYFKPSVCFVFFSATCEKLWKLCHILNFDWKNFIPSFYVCHDIMIWQSLWIRKQELSYTLHE